MAAAKQPSKPRPSAVEGGPDPSSVLAGVLRRMGDVLGPGAIYSLVHYAAVEEGLQLKSPPGDPVGAVQAVASLLGLKARVEAGREGPVRVHLQPTALFTMESRACVALVVGLMEGALTTARRRKIQAASEPTLDPDGTLHLDLTG